MFFFKVVFVTLILLILDIYKVLRDLYSKGSLGFWVLKFVFGNLKG